MIPDGAQSMLEWSRLQREMRAGRVMPILTIAQIAHAAPLARALDAGGVRVCEVTLRTPVSLAAITAMRDAAPNLLVGAGTIRTVSDIDNACAAGAQFLVTPGVTPALAQALQSCPAPCVPGAATPSESMALQALGFTVQKFFPAEASGGVGALKAYYGPLPDIAFCPTGAITQALAPAYLALPNVLCVGASWVAPEALLAQEDFATIEELARLACML
jgi:2-dehydro-3-deoxyphosphogluconate aldolase/(4S)-4-hydroxy-2-oxoglutarate aldolase